MDDPQQVPIADIKRVVSDYFGILPIEMISHRRGRRVSWPRQIAMALAYELTTLSYPAIGRHFGGRDHTTVMHAHEVFRKRWRTNAKYARDVELICNRLELVACNGEG